MTFGKTIGWVGSMGLCAACNTSDASLGSGPGLDAGPEADANPATDAATAGDSAGGDVTNTGEGGNSRMPSGDGSIPTIVGNWEGFVEIFTFPDGQDTITLNFAQQSDGSYTGTVLFGVLHPPPPATDPSVGYPPGINNNIIQNAMEGFPYTARSITLDGTRLRFGIASAEVWSVWCGLQTPVLFFPGSSFRCAPPVVLDSSNGSRRCFAETIDDAGAIGESTTAIDCDKASLCDNTSLCVCDASACTSDPTIDALFDVQLNGDSLDGTSAGGLHVDRPFLYGTAMVTVHFTRTP